MRLESSVLRAVSDGDGLVRAALAADLASIEQHLEDVRAERAPRLQAAARHSLLAGGKRLRPLLTCSMLRALGVEPGPHARVIAAVELIHCGSLLHDDVIDGAETRRGLPAAHVAYDAHTAILAGDLLLAIALERLARTGLVPLQLAAAEAIMGVCQGEALERERLFDPECDVEHARRVNHLKTAVLFGYAAEAGAILAEEAEEIRQAARLYGEKLGDAFQTVDDILDWQGEATRVGKPLGRDLLGGLVTVPVAIACERDPSVRELTRRVLEARRAGGESPVSLVDLARAMERAGAFEAARGLATEDARRAIRALAALPPGPWRDFLEETATRAVDRGW